MSTEFAAIALISTLLILLALGVPVFFSLVLVAIGGTLLLLPETQLGSIGPKTWGGAVVPSLAAIPLFVLMGELFAASRVSDRTYGAMEPLASRVPGGLLHSNIAASAVFAAASGSSVGTAASMGSVALPRLHALGYPKPLSYGSLAAGGTLGILIPPSLGLIIYGILTGTSIGDLFIAGIIPGVALALTFSLVIVIMTRRVKMPPRSHSTLLKDVRALVPVLPVLGVVGLVIASLYFGVVTPSESAIVGLFGMTVIVLFYLPWPDRAKTASLLKSTLMTSSMVITIVIGAALVGHVVAYLGIPTTIAEWLIGLGMGKYTLLLVLMVIYVLLGMFLEPISLIALTVPVIFPIVVALGIDPLWFGIFLTVLLEVGLITPPVGLNLFVIRGVDPEASWGDIVRGAFPFAVAMIIFGLVLIAFPSIATWLPGLGT
ncbi:MAG: TRAP transporter large permease [Candidatus Nanopelagicales bacterium]